MIGPRLSAPVRSVQAIWSATGASVDDGEVDRQADFRQGMEGMSLRADRRSGKPRMIWPDRQSRVPQALAAVAAHRSVRTDRAAAQRAQLSARRRRAFAIFAPEVTYPTDSDK